MKLKPPRPPSPQEVLDRVRDTEVWKSVFRPGSLFRKGYKDTSRDRALATMNNVLYHLHPVKMKRHGLKLTYTFCLGGLSFFLFILLTVTGIFLMFFYRPAADVGGRPVEEHQEDAGDGEQDEQEERQPAEAESVGELQAVPLHLHRVEVIQHVVHHRE